MRESVCTCVCVHVCMYVLGPGEVQEAERYVLVSANKDPAARGHPLELGQSILPDHLDWQCFQL